MPRPRRFILPTIVLLSLVLLNLLSGRTAQADDSNLPFHVTDLNGDGVVDCADACEGDIYTIRDFNDALALLYSGLHHNGVKNCDSDARRALVTQWGTLFNCQGDCPDGLQHAWRNADLSQDTSSFLSMVGLPPIPSPKRHGRHPAIIDFCNAYSDPPIPRFGGDSDFLDNDPIRIPCDPHEDVCGADGTLGLVLPIVPPTNLSSEDKYPTSDCTEGVFEMVYEQSELCPDGRPATFGLCSLPVLQPDGGTTDFRCMNASANCPTEAPLNADCRAYNLVLRTENGNVQKDPHGRDGRGAFFRIHASNSVTGETCNATTAEDQLACLRSQAPDSVGLAYGGAIPPPRIIAEIGGRLGKFNDATGFIANAYGAYQAAEAIFNFLADPKSDITKAKEEIIAAINIVQKETLDGVWNGIQMTFDEFRRDPTNTPKREALLARANDLYGTIQAIVDNEPNNTTKIYQFAPEFNMVAAMIALVNGSRSETERHCQQPYPKDRAIQFYDGWGG